MIHFLKYFESKFLQYLFPSFGKLHTLETSLNKETISFPFKTSIRILRLKARFAWRLPSLSLGAVVIPEIGVFIFERDIRLKINFEQLQIYYESK